MYIKRFLIVSYIVSFILVVGWLYKDKLDWIKLGNDDEEILFELFIPCIKLKSFVYNMDSVYNDVDRNIEILSGSEFGYNLFYLASHSGGGKASYFDNLVCLEKGDLIWLMGRGSGYIFVVEDIYYIEKNGYFVVDNNKIKNTLFLITCSLRYVNKQLVVKSNLIYIF